MKIGLYNTNSRNSSKSLIEKEKPTFMGILATGTKLSDTDKLDNL